MMQRTDESGLDSQIPEIENQFLARMFACSSREAVEAATTYARFLNNMGVTPENYPVFLSMLEIENHWVIDALVGDRDPYTMFAAVQPNEHIVRRVLAMLNKWPKGGIYPKNIAIILGVLQEVYRSPEDGFSIRPVTFADVNAIGKHLEKGKGQDDPLNRAILNILEKIAELQDNHNSEIQKLALHASAVINAFLDDRKEMADVIPFDLLTVVPPRKDLAPRKSVPYSNKSAR